MGQARVRARRSWAEFQPPVRRFIPLNPRDGAELGFPVECWTRGAVADTLDSLCCDFIQPESRTGRRS